MKDTLSLNIHSKIRAMKVNDAINKWMINMLHDRPKLIKMHVDLNAKKMHERKKKKNKNYSQGGYTQ